MILRREMIHLAKRLVYWRRINRITDFITRTKVGETVRVRHGKVELTLSTANPQLRSRSTSFSIKEPETLKWIDGFQAKDVLWDIGANIGIYSIYAAKMGVRVVSIEPSVFNLEFLVRNICQNELEHRIQILPLAVGTPTTRFESLHLASSAWGDSGNSLGVRQTAIDSTFLPYTYTIPGLPIDGLADSFGLQLPDHIKIDVDGIEPEIVESGHATFSTVKSVLVEIPTDNGAAERIAFGLTKAGLRLQEVARRNQIWVR